MRKIIVGLVAAVALLFGAASPAFAGGSDSPTPYTVSVDGVRLPAGDTFRAHGHINWKTTTGSYGMHFDPNNNQPGGAFIGKDFFPITLAPGECLTWVQVSHYNEHFGEGGQAPVCAPEEEPEPPFTGVEKYAPTYGATCTGWSYSHPEFRLPSGERPESYTVRARAGTEPVAYTPGEKIGGLFENPYISNVVEVTLWAHYADGKPFVKQQIGQTRIRAAACERPKPDMPEPLSGFETRVSDPVCTVPADGTSTAVREERAWEQGWKFDEPSWSWALDEVVFSEWTVIEPVVVEAEECAVDPVVPEPVDPIDPVDTPRVDPVPVVDPVKAGEVSNPVPELSRTGADLSWYLAAPLAVASIILGLLLVAFSRRGRRS